MRVKKNFEDEWAEVSRNVSAKDVRGRDVIALVGRFADKVEKTQETVTDDGVLLDCWNDFVNANTRSMTVDMYQNLMYLLVTYWSQGEDLWPVLHPFEKLALTELVYEFSEEIKKRSEAAAAG